MLKILLCLQLSNESLFYLLGEWDLANIHDMLLYLPAVRCHNISDKQELGKAVAEIEDWEGLCENLGVSKAVLNTFGNKMDTDSVKKRKCLEAYLTTGKACWEQVVKVVADFPFFNVRLANKIADMHGIDYMRTVKDEL